MQKLRALFILAALLVSALPAAAYDTDSLHRVLKNAEGLDSLEPINAMITAYQDNNPKMAMRYAQIGLDIAKRHGDDYNIANSYVFLGNITINLSQYKKSIENNRKALKIYESHDDLGEMIGMYNNLAVSYKELSYFNTSLKYLLKSLKASRKLNDTVGIPRALTNIGNIYNQMDENQSALKYYNKAYDYIKDRNMPHGKMIVIHNQGNSLIRIGRLDSAKSYLHKSISMGEKYEWNYIVAKSLLLFAELYNKKNNPDSALYYLKEAEPFFDVFENKTDLGTIYAQYAATYAAQKNIPKAVNYYKRALEKFREANSKKDEIDLLEKISEFYYDINDFRNSAKYYKELTAIQDTFMTTQRSRQFADMQAKYDLEHKQGQIEKLKQEKLIKELRNDELNQRIIFLIVLSAILLVAAIAVYTQYRAKNKLIDKLTKSEAKLKEANATKDKFFSIIAHDLRNPLSAMMLSIRMLSEQYDKFGEEERREFLSELSASSENVYALLENLLTWSRSQRGKITFEPEETDVRQLAQNNIELIKPAAEKKNIRLLNNLNDEDIAYCDKNMITTVFRNLFTNAIKYTPIGGEIEIRSEEKNRGGRDFIELAVADTGVGMDENTRRQIFDLAGPKSMPGTNDEKGTGLGLVICKEFVEQNGGTIYAESSPGEGSTFYFTIPKISNI